MIAESELTYRILCRVEPDLYTGCWNWIGCLDRGGYGSVGRGRRTASGHHRPERAHRVAYELFVGPIAPGMHIDHLCRNRRCVNPEHLEPVTSGENTRRGTVLITHCPQGHPYDETNTRWRDGGRHRECLTCTRASARERMRRLARAVS